MLPLYPSDEMVIDTVRQLTDLTHQRAAAVIQSVRYTRLMLGLGHWLESNDWRLSASARTAKLLDNSLERAAATMLEDAAGGVRKAERGLRQLDSAQRHELRKRAKKLRYSVEFLAGLYSDKIVSNYVKTLKKLQRILGDVNDNVVAHTLYARVGAGQGMEDFLSVECKQRLAALPRAWNRFLKSEPFW